MLDEEILKTGSLVRTASMRMKKRKAKSEEQLASERNWISDKVWLVHKGGFSGRQLTANHSNFDRTEDLSSLLHLNDSSILHTLRQRYGANLIHTYAGRNLLIINPTHQLSVYSDKFNKHTSHFYWKGQSQCSSPRVSQSSMKTDKKIVSNC
ncbi:hypothetical protein BSL78_14352 [Apostichopus japonicus]|uniref:Myosin motor domain-containing protein n=1 Tax=Stichopus japonicus TaxID=307972 RepID=A0A2G8KLA2_STIJA|nr:hypothetical protein BSL78_14352 [Apostichopus japonicus]